MFKFFLSLLFAASISASENSKFSIRPGQHHTGGWAGAQVSAKDPYGGWIWYKIDYHVYKKSYLIVPDSYFKGYRVQKFPQDFMDERGYLNLQHQGFLDLPDATVTYLGRASLPSLKDLHHILIKAKDGTVNTEIYYHPSLPGVGWAKMKISIFTPLPILNNYVLEADLVQ